MKIIRTSEQEKSVILGDTEMKANKEKYSGIKQARVRKKIDSIEPYNNKTQAGLHSLDQECITQDFSIKQANASSQFSIWGTEQKESHYEIARDKIIEKEAKLQGEGLEIEEKRDEEYLTRAEKASEGIKCDNRLFEVEEEDKDKTASLSLFSEKTGKNTSDADPILFKSQLKKNKDNSWQNVEKNKKIEDIYDRNFDIFS
jgi:hypothetical protein